MKTLRTPPKPLKTKYLILMILWLPLSLFVMDVIWKVEIKEYPDIVKPKEYKGKIIKCRSSLLGHGTYVFTFSNGERFNLTYGSARNYEYSSNDLLDYLEVDVSIYKPANNDSIYVYSKGKEYYFILGKVINKKEEPKKPEEPYYRKYFHKRE